MCYKGTNHGSGLNSDMVCMGESLLDYRVTNETYNETVNHNIYRVGLGG